MQAVETHREELAEELEEVRQPFWITGATLLSDGRKSRDGRPIVNFLAAGSRGVVVYTTINRKGETDDIVHVLRRWVTIFHEFSFGGPQRVNAICTDSASAYVGAARALASPGIPPALRRITWLPCSVHVCNKLLSDMGTSCDAFVDAITLARVLVVFFKTHQAALHFFRKRNPNKGLVLSCETRFASVYSMLERLLALQDALQAMMRGDDGREFASIPWSADVCDMARWVRRQVRWEPWWHTMATILHIMQPVMELLRWMDRGGQYMSLIIEWTQDLVSHRRDARGSRGGDQGAYCTTAADKAEREMMGGEEELWGPFGEVASTGGTGARATSPAPTRRESSVLPPSAPSPTPPSPVAPYEPTTAAEDTEELASSLPQRGLLHRGGAVRQLRLRSPSPRVLQEEGGPSAAAVEGEMAMEGGLADTTIAGVVDQIAVAAAASLLEELATSVLAEEAPAPGGADAVEGQAGAAGGEVGGATGGAAPLDGLVAAAAGAVEEEIGAQAEVSRGGGDERLMQQFLTEQYDPVMAGMTPGVSCGVVETAPRTRDMPPPPPRPPVGDPSSSPTGRGSRSPHTPGRSRIRDSTTDVGDTPRKRRVSPRPRPVPAQGGDALGETSGAKGLGMPRGSRREQTVAEASARVVVLRKAGAPVTIEEEDSETDVAVREEDEDYEG
ncbi:hypothetical protein CBR_g48391 [Chara braunii]|uniref:DUF659 domain-containing protein n=1 Tax=Chara braunii TaxID=69332 RepID=A0A388M2I6_CHABU|nr:hypothetical protein CBR_g48391 [Chara braunii]|eukprot:GBG88774.1 hypothetical protein CBR_g48391 [Chara braunii]